MGDELVDVQEVPLGRDVEPSVLLPDAISPHQRRVRPQAGAVCSHAFRHCPVLETIRHPVLVRRRWYRGGTRIGRGEQRDLIPRAIERGLALQRPVGSRGRALEFGRQSIIGGHGRARPRVISQPALALLAKGHRVVGVGSEEGIVGVVGKGVVRGSGLHVHVMPVGFWLGGKDGVRVPPGAIHGGRHLEAGIQDVVVKNTAIVLLKILLCLRIERQWRRSIEVVHLIASHRFVSTATAEAKRLDSGGGAGGGGA